MKYPTLRFYIGGKWVDGNPEAGEDVINPATEEVIARLPHASDAHIEAALQAATKGFSPWRREPAAQRRRALLRVAQGISSRKAAMAEVLSLEQGKTKAEAAGEIDRAIETFEWFADEAYRIYGTVYPERSPGIRNTVLSEPVGVVAALTPWNFPVFLPSRKVAPALAAGCSVILKAAEETPGATIMLFEALEEADLPPGAVNLLYGSPGAISQKLLSSPIVRKVSFTGSVTVGKLLAKMASDNLQRCTLELGGHSPLIVFPDADVASVVKGAAAFKFRNAGQVCISPNRFYVHKSVYRDFVDGFVSFAKAVTVGNGLEEGVTMGPLANRRRLDAMDRFVSDAKDKGAEVVCGGRRIGNRGFFWEPTILSDVSDDSFIMREEPFGPIAPITPFTEIDEVMKRSNSLPYGLAAYVFTQSSDIARTMADGLEAGTVGINHMSPAHADIPMSGVKDSGYGYEGGREGLDAYLTRKHVAHSFL